MRTLVRLWRASHVLGAEMVGDYVSKAVPHAERAAFWKCVPSLALICMPVWLTCAEQQQQQQVSAEMLG